MKLYEGVSKTITLKINGRLDRLNKFKHMTTERERQYSFFKFLQSLEITEKQMFDIYTNTNIELTNQKSLKLV